MELVAATAYAASRPRAKVPGVWTEKSRGLKEYGAPFSLCSWCERIALLGPGDAWHDKNEGSGREEGNGEWEVDKIIGTKWYQMVPSHADHAQYGVARLVQQRQCRRSFGDAEAAVSHRLGYRLQQHMMLPYVRTCGAATR
ncbi:hypothetical protein ACHAPV_006663 [Trichoderma viride]